MRTRQSLRTIIFLKSILLLLFLHYDTNTSILSMIVCHAFIIHSSSSSSLLPYYSSRAIGTSSSSSSSSSSIATKSTTTKTKKSSSSYSSKTTTTTALKNGIILDVDDNFFTYTFFSIGLFYSLGKAYNRYLLEEIAFEQRKWEARERILLKNENTGSSSDNNYGDPTLDEYTLRRMESAKWLSVYGRKYRGSGGGGGGGGNENDDGGTSSSRRERSSSSRWNTSSSSRRVITVEEERDDYNEDEDEDEDEDDDSSSSSYRMSPSEISDFESQYNIPYDPYYDEPYTEEELPRDMKYKVDKSYGDRRYENGEIFYKEEGTKYYYRMGSRPRQKKFWDWGGGGGKKK